MAGVADRQERVEPAGQKFSITVEEIAWSAREVVKYFDVREREENAGVQSFKKSLLGGKTSRRRSCNLKKSLKLKA